MSRAPVSTEKMAEILGQHPETIRRWVRSGFIPYLKGPKNFLFDVDAVLATLSHPRRIEAAAGSAK